MADLTAELSLQEWAVENALYDERPPIIAERTPTAPAAAEPLPATDPGGGPASAQNLPVDLDLETGRDHQAADTDTDASADALGDEPVSAGPVQPHPDTATPAPAPAEPDVNAGAKRTLLLGGAGVAVVAVLIVLAFAVLGGGPAPAPTPQRRTPAAAPALTAAPTPAASPAAPRDEAIPYDPATESCPGASSPLALTDTTTDSAWVCSRGPQESLLDGQVLHVAFTCPRPRPESRCSYIVNALSVTPGWVAKTAGGRDEWLQHRVVTRLQFNFFNGDALAADPFVLDTHSVHGPVPAVLPGKILASRVDVIILHTERPPAAPQPAVNALTPPGGLVDSILGSAAPAATPLGDPALTGTATDPVDATLAISQLQFFGHTPS